MPSKLKIEESSEKPAEYGGKIGKLDSGKATARASRRRVEEADTKKSVPVVQGGSIKKVKRPPRKDRRWFYDDRENPLHVRQWVYEVILVAAALVFLISFLVIVISCAKQGKLDLQSFLGGIGTFLGGLGIGYYRAKRRGKRRKPRPDDDEEQEDGGDDTS